MRSVMMAVALAGLVAAGAQAQPTAGGAEIASPQWLRKPSPGEMRAAWPVAMARTGKGGRAVIACKVDVTGLLQNCEIASEDPPGSGFGAAALMLSGSFQMKPMTVDGKPVAGGVVRVPIIFFPSRPRDVGKGAPAVNQPVWSRAPSFADMAAAWPAKAGDLDYGAAVLRCGVTEQGLLKRCVGFNELPKDKGFEAAAMGLTDRFQLRVTPEEAKALKGAFINVSFKFLNPATPDGQARAVAKPRWIVMIDPAKVLALYPGKAADAGVGKGKGVADCLVAADGKLTDCRVDREEPAGLGFGTAAAGVAEVMQMNPWTDEGRPVDGARIKLPITFTQAEDAAAEAKP